MDDITQEFNDYVAEYFAHTNQFRRLRAIDDLGKFLYFIQPLWKDLSFLTYYDTFDGIEDYQRGPKNMLLKSTEDEEIIFEPTNFLINISEDDLIDLAAITTTGAVTNLNKEILGINTPIFICPWTSKYVFDEDMRNSAMTDLTEYELKTSLEETAFDAKLYLKNHLQYRFTQNMKINSKELRNKIEEEIGLFRLLEDK